MQAWLTTSDGANQLTQQANLPFGTNTGNASTITVNDYQKLQQMIGFGAAITDSSAWLMFDEMSSTQRTALMEKLFSPTQGIGISFVRIPMGLRTSRSTEPIPTMIYQRVRPIPT